MFEKVNPSHPDKIADRIGGAIVDLGYKKMINPIIAGECLIGHNQCNIIIETNVDYEYKEILDIVVRITNMKNIHLNLLVLPQDKILAKNQELTMRCGDNGVFKGVPISDEEQELTKFVQNMYKSFPYDGKYIYDKERDYLVVCQSNAFNIVLENECKMIGVINTVINPLGTWTGGINVDTGATNRKLGSDMGRAVTGGGCHFKDLSKADVSVNIYCHLLAQEHRKVVEASCAIGDDIINIKENGSKFFGCVSYDQVVEMAKRYIVGIGGFEKFAEWGLIR